MYITPPATLQETLRRCLPNEVVLVIYWPKIDLSMAVTVARDMYPTLLEKYAEIMDRYQQQAIVEVFEPQPVVFN